MAISKKPQSIPRHELIAAALDLGIPRPESLSTGELSERIRSVSEGEPPLPSGWISVAKHLLASVVDQGLNLPEAARMIRGGIGAQKSPRQRPPYPTVTLAQIYLAQGHQARARTVLTEVIELDPDNAKAQQLMAGILAQCEPSLVQSESATESGSAPAEAASVAGGLLEPRFAAVVLVRAEGATFLYWELATRPAEAIAAGGTFFVLIDMFEPSWSGAKKTEVRLELTTARGVERVACGEKDIVRAVLAKVEGDGFSPLAVASTHRQVQQKLQLDFNPRPGQEDELVAKRAFSEFKKSGNHV